MDEERPAYHLWHLTAQEATAVQQLLSDLKIPRTRIFWSTTQTNTNDWHCTIVAPTPAEIECLDVLRKEIV